jgi:hypothetical protein
MPLFIATFTRKANISWLLLLTTETQVARALLATRQDWNGAGSLTVDRELAALTAYTTDMSP